jgi:hypothetical protein
MEHRWGVRSRIDVPVQIDCSSGVIVLGVMHDASVSGAFVTTAVPLPTMTVVKLVPMTTRCRPRGGVEAYVVRRTAEGAGLEWSDLAPLSIVELLATQEAEPIAAAQRGERRIAKAPERRPSQVREREREDVAV